MRVDYHPRFKKQYKKLRPTQQQRFDRALRLFTEKPFDPRLYNHPLTGNWKGHRSISFGGDSRAHYREMPDGSALFVAIGTHSQLYK